VTDKKNIYFSLFSICKAVNASIFAFKTKGTSHAGMFWMI
jgi:hypothetical protein